MATITFLPTASWPLAPTLEPCAKLTVERAREAVVVVVVVALVVLLEVL